MLSMKDAFQAKLRIALGAAALVASSAAAPALANGTRGAVLAVNVTIQRSAVLNVAAAPIPLFIAPVDIQRGFVQISTGNLLSISAGGVRPIVVMEIALGDGTFRSIELRTQEDFQMARAMLFGEIQTAIGGNLNLLPPTGAGADMADSNVFLRFNLSEDARPGGVSVPVTLDISL